MMKRLILLLAALAALAQDTKKHLEDLAGITGLSLLKPVEQQTMARDQLKGYFEDRIKEVVKPEEIRIEELTLKKFGFVPPDFDLKGNTIELMSEQAAAFYDYRKKKMVLLEGGGGIMQEATLVHELSHALADQHFHLERFLKKAGSNDDGTLARTAVMEGQATYLMSEWMARRMGQSLKDSPEMVEMMSRMAAAGGSGFPVFEKAPLYVRESLLFPYAQGMRFQHQVVMKLGQPGFAEVFKRAPQSTREILHPEVYFEKWTASSTKAPELAREKDWKKLAEGTVGEFDHKVLLKQYAASLELLSSEWRGASYRLWEHKQNRRVVLAYVSEWADETQAQSFFGAYRTVLEKKWKQTKFTEESAARLAGTSEDGHFVVRREGNRVTSVEGMKSASEAR